MLQLAIDYWDAVHGSVAAARGAPADVRQPGLGIEPSL